MTAGETTLPLQGITVVSLEQAVAAPFATRQMADLGARVIKVERPGVGDFAREYESAVHGQSSYFVWLNRSKESITLDIRSEPGLMILNRLLDDADVFVQNLGPGATRRLGLGADVLRAEHTGMVVCDISGYGSDGPWADRKAYDLLVQCEAGLASVTGSAAAAAKVGISVADIAAGMYAFSGILAALYRRAATGAGSHVEVSLFEALAEWMGAPMYYTNHGGQAPQRVGLEHATIAPYGPFVTADNRTIVIAVHSAKEWTALCETVLGAADLAADVRFRTNADRVANRVALSRIITETFAGLDAETALARLDSVGLASARVNTMQELIDHPVLSGRHRWRDVDTPGGRIAALLPPPTIDGLEPRMDAVPGLGEHTESVLQGVGFTHEQIAEFWADATI